MCTPLQPIAIRENIFGDNIASAEYWDFSQANMNDTNRITVVTRVASICYQNPKVLENVENGIGSESLYNRLLAESHSLPSSSFEFVPVLLHHNEVLPLTDKVAYALNKDEVLESNYGISLDVVINTLEIEKYGCWIKHNNETYLLTNYRAIVYDFEKYGDRGVDLRKRFNTEEECEIIKQYYQVFRFKVDMPTRSQMVRHRVHLQELSRRYVSGKRVAVDHYISDKMKDVVSKMTWTKVLQEVPCGLNMNDDLTGFAGAPIMGYISEEIPINYTTQQVIDICMNHYYQALEDGVKPQEARRIIPQTGYTEFWMGFLPFQLDNFFRLRDDSHAQWEVRQAAIAMKDMLGMPYEK